MGDDQLNDKELAELKLYFATLDEIRGIDDSGFWTDEQLRGFTSIYKLIEKLGGGDPVKAAHKHAKTLQDVNRAIELSGGNQSQSIH